MIDHQHRLIFIHQRKVAGTSIINALGFKPENPDWHRFNDGVLSPDWETRSDDERHYFTISAVRNPFDRLVSGWKYLGSTRAMSLEDVLGAPPADGAPFRHLTRPQVGILRDPATGELIVNDLIRYETLQDDFDRMCDWLGISRRTLEWTNPSQRERTYREYFTDKTRRLAEAMFADDLETFGYAF